MPFLVRRLFDYTLTTLVCFVFETKGPLGSGETRLVLIMGCFIICGSFRPVKSVGRCLFLGWDLLRANSLDLKLYIALE